MNSLGVKSKTDMHVRPTLPFVIHQDAHYPLRQSFLSASLPLLFASGVPPEVIRVLEDRAKAELELQDGSLRMFIKIHACWAKKRG